MHHANKINDEITALGNRIVDLALLFFVVFGTVAEVFMLLRALKFGFTVVYWIHFFSFLAVFIVATFRKRVELQTKVFVIIFSIIVAFSTGLNEYGFLSSSKLYITVVPSFIALVSSYRKSMLFLIACLIIYVVYGFLYSFGLMHYTVNAATYTSSIPVWLMELCILVFTSMGLLYIGNQYNKTILANYKTIQEKNDELEKHHHHLELLVRERTFELEASNEELKSTNDELIAQRGELQRTIKQLNDTQAQLIETEKMASIGILTAGVAHEINNPLNFLQSGLYSLQEMEKDSEYFSDSNKRQATQQRIMANMQEGIQRISRIVKSLNQFNRSNSKTDVCKINNIVNNCLQIIEHETKSKCEIICKYDDTDISIIGNEGKLHQVFLNVLVNAYQAIETQGTIMISIYKLNSNIVTEISDTGVGIQEKNLGRIYEPFFTTKEPGKGTGLGLFIAYKIVTEHGGEIAVNSTLGSGTCVRISLPLKF